MSIVQSLTNQAIQQTQSSNNKSNLEIKKAAGLSFEQVLQRVGEKLGLNSKLDLHAELMGLQKQALTKSNFSNKELLVYQVKAGQMHMEVELVSKVAESMLATLRKLQQGQ